MNHFKWHIQSIGGEICLGLCTKKAYEATSQLNNRECHDWSAMFALIIGGGWVWGPCVIFIIPSLSTRISVDIDNNIECIVQLQLGSK